MSAGSSTQSILSDNSSTTDEFNVTKDESTDQNSISILKSHQGFKIKDQFILKLSKNSNNVSIDVKNSCKILQFSSEWNFEEVLAAIDELKSEDYPQLFIFVIDSVNFAVPTELEQNTKKLREKLLKFGRTRPLVLQVTSVDEKSTKIYYRIEDSFQFIATDKPNNTDPFPTFLSSFYGGQYDDSEIEVLDAVKELRNSLVLRFLQTFELSDGFFSSLVLDLAGRGSKNEFIAAFDAPFVNEGRIPADRAQRVFKNDDDPKNVDSVLLKAVNHQNSGIIDFLITYWSHLIQQFPFDHQVRISTAAYETNQLEVLCDLLDIADFPFPMDFKSVDVVDQNLRKIVNERQELADAIKAGNHPNIKQFIDNNPSLRIVYNSANKSALQQAIDAKNYKVYFFLNSYGFAASEFYNLEDVLTADELKAATQPKIKQRRQNVNEALTENLKSVNLLCNRSFIHNRRIKKEQEVEYRKKIRKWYEDINKIKFGDLFLDVAASCKDLKIIFDFDNCSVENLSFQSSGTEGSMFPSSKWIFVGAKLTDSDNKPREQKIKGVLAHELCHYVMKLVYENQENPYYKIMIKIAELFEEIVKEINKWSAGGQNIPDDECNGIISTVFRLYPVKDFHPELIVRVVQILTEFDDDLDKSQHLQDKYKILFDFWENYVIPELRKFNLKSREAVRKINRLLELLKCLKSKSYTFNSPKEIETLFDNELTIVNTNVPTLLFNDILNYLQDTVGDLLDAKNIFVDPGKLKNEEILKDFKELLKDNPNLNVIVDCSYGIPKDVDDFRGSKIILVVSNKTDRKELVNALKDPKNKEISYNWSDLTTKNQELLIDTKVNFQNKTELTLLKLLMPENNLKELESSDAYKKAKSQVLSDFFEFIDDQLLNLLVNCSDIIIDVSSEDVDVQKDKNFTSIFIKRTFSRKVQDSMKGVPNVSHNQLLLDVQDKPVVLISDIAGNGKSWVMKNFVDIFRLDKKIKWVTYVDLKQFIDEFKAQKGETDFAAFMAEKILKPRQQFEVKIFKKLYKIGKVLILFDGFDEIAPDCAEFVSKLAQNFQQNGGNQLWISTRDYFEIDLKQKLKTNAVYRLADLTFNDAVNLIAKRWMENDNKYTSEKHESNKNENFQNYREKAQKIVQKFHLNRIRTVGMPLLFKILAETFVANKDCSEIDVTIIFKMYIEKLIKIWSLERGKIRQEASLKCQEFDFGSWKIHHYWAIATLFPELAKILFPDYDPSEWTDLLIVSCGLINKNGENFFFIHETYREYFVADYLVKALKKPKIGDVALKVLTKVLVNQKFYVIRMFLNGLVDDLSNLRKLKQFNKILKDEEFENFFVEMFAKNLDKFADFFIENFKSLSYEEKLEILKTTAGEIAIDINDSKSFEKFKNLIFENNLTTEDLKDLILNQGLLQRIIESSLDFVEFENFVSEVESKTDREFIREALTAKIKNYFTKGNIFYSLCKSRNLSLQKFQKTLKICQNFLEFDEICGLVRNCNKYNENVFHVLSQSFSQNQLCQIWQEIENFYKTHDASDQFRELTKQKDWLQRTVLSNGALNCDIEFYKNIWELMLHTFEDREELKEFIINNNQENFIHTIIVFNSNLEVVKLTFDVFKQNFTDAQFTEIIKSKSIFGFNLLFAAFGSSKFIKTHMFLWTFFKDFYGSDEEFLKMVQEVDENERNIIQICVVRSTKEIFEFLIEELEKLSTCDEIRKLSSHLDEWDKNILQKSAEWNESPELHESVWKVLRKYFEALEIVNLIKHVDKFDGENVLFYAFKRNKLQILELTWNEIKKNLSHDEQVQYLKIKNKKGFNLLERAKNVEFFDKITKDKVEWVIKTFKEYKIDFTDE